MFGVHKTQIANKSALKKKEENKSTLKKQKVIVENKKSGSVFTSC